MQEVVGDPTDLQIMVSHIITSESKSITSKDFVYYHEVSDDEVIIAYFKSFIDKADSK